jgi:PAS domain S-box-containing protein
MYYATNVNTVVQHDTGAASWSPALLLENLPGFAYRCRYDRYWTMLFLSSAVEDLTGYAPDDLLHNRRLAYCELIHPDDAKRCVAEIDAAVAARRAFQLRYRITTASGRTKWLWEQGIAVQDASGNVIALEGYVTDITRRVQEREALQASEARYRSIFQLVPVCIWEEDWRPVSAWLTRLRHDGVQNFADYFDANPECVRKAIGQVRLLHANDVTMALFRTRSLQETAAAIRRAFRHPAAMPVFQRRLLAYVDGDQNFETELSLQMRDGTRVHLLHKSTIPSTGDGVVLVSATDISKRRHAEQVILRVARSVSIPIGDGFFERLTERGVEALQADWCMIGLLEGEARERVVTRAVARPGGVLGSIDYVLPGTPCSRVLQTGEPQILCHSVQAQFPDDHMLTDMGVDAYAAAPMISQTQTVIGLVAVLYKRSLEPSEGELILSTLKIFAARAAAELERQQTDARFREQQEQLLHAQRLEAVGKLTGGVAHDFNNLLTVILGNADLLTEMLQRDPSAQNFAAMITQAAQRGAELTQRLLAFARRQPLAPRDVDVNALIQGMDGILRRTLGSHIEVVVQHAPGLWLAHVDAAQLEHALLNLCLNARDAMPAGGRLTITTAGLDLIDGAANRFPDAPPGSYVLLEVGDSGTGIAPEHLDHVFEPFFTTKAMGRGTGLGLSTVYGFVKQSGGHIELDSAFGRGTTIRMLLPRSRATASSPIVPATHGTLARGAETVLLVEDDTMVRRFAHEQLVRLGYVVITAENGPAGLAALQAHDDIDLLFTDVVMPGGMSGRQLAEAALVLRPALKVLYTSGYTDNELSQDSRLADGVQLLTKPYSRTELAARIRAALDASQPVP